jgi:hypothetical protein
MQSTPRERLVQFGHVLQSCFFPAIEDALGPLSERAELLVAVVGMVELSRYIAPCRGWRERRAKDRHALATGFLAKAVYGLETTRQVRERLQTDRQLRVLCGWREAQQVPHESTFSRAFAEFAQSQLPQRLHEALIRQTQAGRLVGHIARDSTAIEARERFPEQTAQRAARQKKHGPTQGKPNKANRGPENALGKQLAPKPIGPRKRGRPKKSERALPNKRLPRQRRQTLEEMLSELPYQCSLGVKKSSKGYQTYWRGYKLHIDVADGQIPITCLLTAASLHDSQAAIPLATLTAQRVTSLYDLMDAAYDAQEIHAHSRSLGHVPIIAANPSHVPVVHRSYQDSLRGYDKRRKLPTTLPRRRPAFTTAQEERYHLRTMSERVNARLKDEFGGRTVRVRGAGKVMAHLMFGILALTVDQLLRLAG